MTRETSRANSAVMLLVCAALFVAVLTVAVLCSGCAQLSDTLSDMSVIVPPIPINSTPVEPGETPPDGVEVAYSVTEVFSGVPFKLCALAPVHDGLVVGLCSGYGTGSTHLYWSATGEAGTWRRKEIQNAETITGGVTVDGTTYFVSEHTRKVLLYANGSFRTGVPSPGRWGGGTTLMQGEPVAFYNNQYGGGRMDKASLHNLRTGARLLTMDRACFPFTAVVDSPGSGYLWATCSLGWRGIWRSDGTWIVCDANTIEYFDHTIYFGGGSRFGEGQRVTDGRLWRLDGLTPVLLTETPCSAMTDMQIWQGRLWACGIDPDTLFVLQSGKWTHVSSKGNETAADNSRGLGGSLAVFNNTLFWGRSDKKRGYVYLISVQE